MTTHTQTPEATAADAALKARHAAMWALGDYPAVAREIIPELGRVLVDACRVTAGQDVLDVAAGTGNASIPAARAGARVVACDLSPALLDVGRGGSPTRPGSRSTGSRAMPRPCPSPTRPSTSSCRASGVMFAPHHEAAADELVRVARPGAHHRARQLDAGGLHRADVRGDEAVCRAAASRCPAASAVGRRGARARPARRPASRTLTAEKRSLPVHFDRPEDFRDFFKRTYGPTIVTYRGIADDPDKVAALDDGPRRPGPRPPGRRRADGLGVPPRHRPPGGLTAPLRRAAPVDGSRTPNRSAAARTWLGASGVGYRRLSAASAPPSRWASHTGTIDRR